jgi:hypothetical protein
MTASDAAGHAANWEIMVMTSKTAKEKAEIDRDMRWWRDKLPSGWRLIGFTNRIYASAVSPAGRKVYLDGEFLEAVYDR